MSQQLIDRTAVITGAASGIGRGIAEILAEAGANIVVADVRREPKQGKHFDTDIKTPTDELVADEYEIESLYIETDTSDPNDVERMVDQTIERFDGIDILVNNAGIQVLGTTQEISIEEWYRVMDVNATGYFLTAKFAFPALHNSPSGRIINLSSINANFGGGGAPYATSKAGVINLTRDMAIEAAETDITVNAVLPGVVKTPMQDQNDPETMERQEETTLLSRLGEPEDVGKAVRFLASDDAEWITGAQLLVDGGYCATGY